MEKEEEDSKVESEPGASGSAEAEDGVGRPAAEADLSPLPGGWGRHVDDETGHEYYHDERTGATQWERPAGEGHASSSTTTAVDGETEAPRTSGASCLGLTAGPAAAAPRGLAMDVKKLRKVQNKDYSAMAAMYRREREYRVLGSQPVCCMCREERVVDTLFPCEHKCVCRSCLAKNQIGESSDRSKWALCPLCCTEIKKIMYSDGFEVEQYWNWVMEVKPRLPPKFGERFEFAAAYLRQPPDEPTEAGARPMRLTIPMAKSGVGLDRRPRSKTCVLS